MRSSVESGTLEVAVLREAAITSLEAAGAEVDYVEVVDPTSLKSVDRIAGEALVLAAAFFGDVRLIDNRILRS